MCAFIVFFNYLLSGPIRSRLFLLSQANPIVSDRVRLLKEAFQLLWALAMHTPLPLRDMAQGAGVFNTMVSGNILFAVLTRRRRFLNNVVPG